MSRAAETLAAMCVTARMEKRALMLPEVREQFEDLVGRERVMRQHAERLRQIAKERASEEDTSLGGYADTLLERLTPIPHTGGEAVIRGAGLLGGAGAGYHLGKKYLEPLDPEEIHRVLLPADRGKKGPLPLARNLREIMEARGKSPSMPAIMKILRKHNPEDVSRALRVGLTPWLPGPAAEIRDQIASRLGPEGLPLLRREMQALAKETAGKDAVGSLTKSLRPHRLGGALAGAAAGGVVTGIPFALRALYLKHKGGEAAHRARSEMEATLGRAEDAARKREELLKELPA